MSASINMKTKNVNMSFLKKAAGYIGGGAVSYVKEVMPDTTSTLSEAKNSVSAVSSAFINTSQTILPKIRQLRTQINFRGINNWFMEKEDEYEGGASDSELSFDTPTDSSDFAESQISELGKNANQISQAVVSSSHKLVESQLAATANLMATAEKQTAVLTAGFDKTNETLSKILEVLTKNTSALIETSVAANSGKSANDEMAGSGKFNLSQYKKMVSGNVKNSELGMLAMLPSMLSGDNLKEMLSPSMLIQMAMGAGINKAAPNLKKNMAALDSAVNDTIMTSLIRLGEDDSYGFKGKMSRLFGIDSTRKNTNTNRSSLELKTVPFDSIAHEAISNAIPGYLRKILVAVGGPDEVYDYRSRSFRTKGAIRKEFHDVAASKGTLYGASGKVRNAVGGSNFANMTYDMMMTDLGSKTRDGKARGITDKFHDAQATEDYIINTVLAGMNLSPEDIKRAGKFAKNLGKTMGPGGKKSEVMQQVTRNNVNRNNRTKQYVETAGAYNIDLSDLQDSVGNDLDNIASSYGHKRKSSSTASQKGPRFSSQSGIDYTNAALFEIYRKLNNGINVFQTGNDRSRNKPYKDYGERYLQKPSSYKVKPITDSSDGSPISRVVTGGSDFSEEENLLQNQNGEDGTSENLTRGQRLSRWGKKRGGTLKDALFSGSPEQVKDAFGLMFRDISQVAGSGIKKGAAKINGGAGNFTGYLKHKLTGAAYISGQDEDGNDIEVAKNDKRGILGYLDDMVFGEGGAKAMMKKTTSAGSKWFKSVAGYFNYGSKDPAEQGVAGKRKSILGTSVGAMLGMGIIGGPLGIIMGGLAGSALASTDGIGSKITKLLFGDKEHEGDKKKDANKRRGLLGRAVDGIVDPIKYQIGKTMTTFGSVLKKNILGPLSNIGAAIKDRMANAAGGVVSKVFGGIFKGATGILKKLVMLPLSIVKAPVTMMGGLARGAAEGGGAVAGGFLNSIAKGIAGKHGKDEQTQRRKDQRSDAANDRAKSGFYGEYEKDENGELVLDSKGKPKKLSQGRDYKSYKKAMDAQRANMKFGEYTAERPPTPEEKAAAEAAKETAKNTEKLAEEQQALSNAVRGEIIPGSSFKSHDEGIHERLDRIIDVLLGRKTKKVNVRAIKKTSDDNGMSKLTDTLSKNAEESDSDSFTSSAITAAATFASSGDSVTSDESKAADGIFTEAGKRKASKSTITAKLRDLMGMQQKKKEEKGEEGKEKKSFLERIFDTVKGGFGSLLGSFGGIATGLAGLLGISDLKSLWTDVIKGDMNLSEWWGEKSLIGKGVNGLMEVSKFVGSAGGPIVNKISSGIGTLTKMVPFLPDLSPPQIDTTGPFAGLATGILGGLYLKGASAIGSIGSAAASLLSAGGNILGGKGKGLGKYAGIAAGGLAVAGSMAGWAQGGYKHENTDGAGNQIIDQTKQGAFDSTSGKYLAHTVMGTIDPISGKSSMGGKFFHPNGGSVFNATKPPVTSMTSATGKTINKVDDVWKFAESGRTVSASQLAKATPNISTVADAADSKGAIGFVKKALEGIKNFLMKNKAVEAFAKTIGTKIDDMISKIVSGGQKIFQKAANKVVSIITRGTVKEAGSAATLGIGYAVMAFGGALSGGLSAANIFGVREKDVNGTMRTISSIIVAMLNGVPGLWALELADLVLEPLLGINVRSFLCELLYGLLGGGEDLNGKKETFQGDLSSYNQQYGAELSTDEYNDMTNKGMFAKMFGKGAVKTDESGRAMFDDAGEALRTNHGVAGWFAGGEKEYAKDANGAIIHGEDGKAVEAMDANGKTIKKNNTWTDNVGNWFHDVGGFFGGKTTYKTDENGQAIIGEDGKGVVESKEGNIFQRGGAAVSDWWGGKEVMGPDGKMTKTTGFADAASKTLGNIGSTIAKPFQDAGSAVAKWWGGDTELDENGQPILDEDGKPVKKGGFADWASKGIGKFTSTASNVIRGVTSSAKDAILGEYEKDENGQPILDENQQPIRKGGLAGWIKGGLGKINTAFVEPAKEMVKGAGAWVADKAKWLGDGASDVASWIGGKATGMWKAISEPVQEFTSGAKNWLGDKAKWLGDKASDVGGWISEKAGGMWKAISEPVKDAAASASEWVNKKASWISDKAKDAGDWISTNTGKLFGCITDNVKGLVDGASKWATEKADWVKDGVKDAGDWIGEKAKSVWDWVTGGINKIADKGEQSKQDEQYIQSQQKTGGSGGARIGGIGGSATQPHSATESSPVSTSNSSLFPSPFIGSKFQFSAPGYENDCDYGWRTLRGAKDYHTGIDLAPTSGDWSVGAVAPATVTQVGNTVATTKGGSGYGNYVEYETSDGTKILNGHMAPNSIPSGIRPGAQLTPGDKIGKMGTTGNSTGNHLHFETRNQSVTDERGGHSFNPAPLLGLSTVSDTGNYNSSAMSGDNSSFINTDADGDGNSSGSFWSILKDAGNQLMTKLSELTGGIIPLPGSSNSSISSSGSNDSYSSYGNGTCAGAADFLRLCANEIGTKEEPAGSNKTKYGAWYGLQDKWCMMFVQWCFNQAGLKLEHKSASCSETLSWWQQKHPDRVIDTPKPGDIVIFSKWSHTGIVEVVNGNKITTIEGNTSSGNGSQDNGGCVARKERNMSDVKKFIRPVDFDKMSASTVSTGAVNGTLGTGQTLVVPSSYGTSVSYEKEILKGKYNHPTHGWANSSNQGQMRKDAIASGRIKPSNMYGLNNVASIDGRALIATPWPRIGNQLPVEIGDHLDVKFEDGTVWNTMLGDTKNPSDAGMTSWGHANGKNTVELIYWDYNHNPQNVSKKVTGITKTGKNYRDGIGGIGGASSIGSQNQLKASTTRPNKNQHKMGIGGKASSIRNNVIPNITKTKSPIKIQSSLGSPSYGGLPLGIEDPEVSIVGHVGGSTDKIENLLVQVIKELISINGNTGSSSNLLGALNEKGFVDKGLRDSMTAVAKSQKNTNARHVQGNPNNIRTVAAMARP